MAQFEAFDSNVEIIGKTVRVVVETMALFERMATDIFAKHGIMNVADDGWYPQQAYLDVFREIYERIGLNTMKMIGKQVPDKVLWPPNITTIEEALASIDVAYHMNHRGGEIGYYRFEQTGQRSGTIVSYNPYPCPFDHGLIEATAKKFASPGMHVHVAHDQSQPCRVNGGDRCTYHISWVTVQTL